MMNNNQAHFHFQQPQTEETQVTLRGRDLYSYRYAYARSAECQQNGDPGQDYLAFREDGSRLAFVLCDGVGQSFFGDLAASFLGDRLLEWLWNNQAFAAEKVQAQLQAHLNSLVLSATQVVADQPLPIEIPDLLRSVLEEKRVQGSESMLTGGLLDFTRRQALLVSLGDMRLRIWGASRKEITSDLGVRPDTSTRWSTLRGVIGQVNVKTLSLDTLSCMAAYSDGLARLDTSPVIRLSGAAIQQEINQTLTTPASDDVSFFEVCLGQPAAPLSLPAPSLRLTGSAKERIIFWSSISGASGYEVRLSGSGSTVVAGTSWPVPAQIGRSGGTVQVRALAGEEVGEWSEAVVVAQALPQAPGSGPIKPPAPPPDAPTPPIPAPEPHKAQTRLRWIILASVAAVLLLCAAALALRAVIGPVFLATATPTLASTSTVTEVPATRTPRPSSTWRPSLTPTRTASPTPTATNTATVSPSPVPTQPAYPAPETAIYPPPEPDAVISATGTDTAVPPLSSPTPQVSTPSQ